ncbi:MAG: hypothetical protein VKK42_13140 [Lyngbya sp.]|nr:hypothetical protein [Lyngbya sp.]
MLLWLFCIAIAEQVFSTVLTLIEIFSPVNIPAVSSLQHLRNYLVNDLLFIPLIFVNLLIILLFFIWIYRLHKDLCKCYKNYPINAGDAVYNLIIPLVNIWRIWKNFRTIGRYFKRETGRLHRYGLLIERLVILIYGIFIALFLLEKLLYESRQGVTVTEPILRNIPEFIAPFAFAFKELLELGFTSFVLVMIQTINNAIQLKVAQIKAVFNF